MHSEGSHHRRGLSQQYRTDLSARVNKQHKEDYERAVFGMENSLKDHMLGVGVGIGKGAAARNSLTVKRNMIGQYGMNTSSMDQPVGQGPRLSLPKINVGQRNQMQQQLYTDLNAGQGPFIGRHNIGGGIGAHGPGNVFGNLQQSPGNVHNLSSSINKSGDMHGLSIEQTTMMTNNQSLQQNSISHHQVSYDHAVDSQQISTELAGGKGQFAAAPLTQRQPAVNQYGDVKTRDL